MQNSHNGGLGSRRGVALQRSIIEAGKRVVELREIVLISLRTKRRMADGR